MTERTLLIVKPDGYARGLTGQILARAERCGLRLIAIRVSNGEAAMIGAHYPQDEGWLGTVGGKTLTDHERLGISVSERLGTNDPVQIGRLVRQWLVEFLSSGPLVPIVLSGNRAIETVRKLVGNTLPINAAPGTIRGDFSSDSTDAANEARRPVANLVHASGDLAEAEREIALWYPGLNT
jgi:nucleoside-diphosphate kinase